jgi:hypothetical protein
LTGVSHCAPTGLALSVSTVLVQFLAALKLSISGGFPEIYKTGFVNGIGSHGYGV